MPLADREYYNQLAFDESRKCYPTRRIIGGENVKRKAHPWQVEIMASGRCGGTLISDKVSQILYSLFCLIGTNSVFRCVLLDGVKYFLFPISRFSALVSY